MENKETKSYKEVYEKEGSYDKILKQYNYCESDNVSSTNTSSGNETYFNIIRSVLNNKENQYSNYIDFSLMNEINWIALWKTNRIIELDKDTRDKLLKLKNGECLLDKEIEELLQSMLNCKGIQIAMASTILHFYRPDLFPIIDKRAWRAIHNIVNEKGEISLSNDKKPQCNEFEWDGIPFEKSVSSRTDKKIRQYLNYIKICKHLSEKLKIKFEEIDQFLYEIDKLTEADITDVYIYETQK